MLSHNCWFRKICKPGTPACDWQCYLCFGASFHPLRFFVLGYGSSVNIDDDERREPELPCCSSRNFSHQVDGTLVLLLRNIGRMKTNRIVTMMVMITMLSYQWCFLWRWQRSCDCADANNHANVVDAVELGNSHGISHSYYVSWLYFLCYQNFMVQYFSSVQNAAS